jgi:hypothetical protein
MPPGLWESRPGVRLAWATTIEPCAERPARPRPIPIAALCVGRHGLGVQMPLHPPLGPSPQVARGEEGAVSPSPIWKPRAGLPQFLA